MHNPIIHYRRGASMINQSINLLFELNDALINSEISNIEISRSGFSSYALKEPTPGIYNRINLYNDCCANIDIIYFIEDILNNTKTTHTTKLIEKYTKAIEGSDVHPIAYLNYLCNENSSIFYTESWLDKLSLNTYGVLNNSFNSMNQGYQYEDIGYQIGQYVNISYETESLIRKTNENYKKVYLDIDPPIYNEFEKIVSISDTVLISKDKKTYNLIIIQPRKYTKLSEVDLFNGSDRILYRKFYLMKKHNYHFSAEIFNGIATNSPYDSSYFTFSKYDNTECYCDSVDSVKTCFLDATKINLFTDTYDKNLTDKLISETKCPVAEYIKSHRNASEFPIYLIPKKISDRYDEYGFTKGKYTTCNECLYFNLG